MRLLAPHAARRMAAALAAIVTLAAAAPERPTDPPDAAEAARVFCGYVEARDRHDFAKARALTAPDIRWLDTEGRNHPKNDERLKTMLAWEGVMGGKWSCRVLGFADGWLEVEVSEQNRT